MSASQAAGDVEPEIEWAWTNDDTSQGNAKAIRVDASDNIFTVAGAASTTLFKLNSSGVVQWDSGSDYNDMQLNDLSVNSDGTMAMVGH